MLEEIEKLIQDNVKSPQTGPGSRALAALSVFPPAQLFQGPFCPGSPLFRPCLEFYAQVQKYFFLTFLN